MASRYTRAGRVGRLATPLGYDRLLLVAFEGREAMSELFRFRLQALAPVDVPIDFDDLLGAAASVSLFQDPNRAGAGSDSDIRLSASLLHKPDGPSSGFKRVLYAGACLKDGSRTNAVLVFELDPDAFFNALAGHTLYFEQMALLDNRGQTFFTRSSVQESPRSILSEDMGSNDAKIIPMFREPLSNPSRVAPQAMEKLQDPASRDNDVWIRDKTMIVARRAPLDIGGEQNLVMAVYMDPNAVSQRPDERFMLLVAELVILTAAALFCLIFGRAVLWLARGD